MKYDIESIKKRKEKVRQIRKFVDIILAILIYNVVIITLSCMNKIETINILGYEAYVITTDSMEPNLKIGDVVISKKSNSNSYENGDIITFSVNGEIITHRIVRTEDDEIVTKGDNNTAEDKNKLKYDDIHGKMVIKIPCFGKFIMFLQNKVIFLIIILIMLILSFYRLNRLEKIENRREKKEIEREKEKSK